MLRESVTDTVCIQARMSEKNPTADYRKYSKGPNFGLIVGLSCVVFVLILAAAIFILHERSSKMLPHGPNPTPNSSLSRPAGPVLA